MTQRRPGRATTRLDSQEIARMAEASRDGRCPECARREPVIEELRHENHVLRTSLHAAERRIEEQNHRIDEMESRQGIVAAQVAVLAAQVAELTR